jgi:WD40 repeat protein
MGISSGLYWAAPRVPVLCGGAPTAKRRGLALMLERTMPATGNVRLAVISVAAIAVGAAGFVAAHLLAEKKWEADESAVVREMQAEAQRRLSEPPTTQSRIARENGRRQKAANSQPSAALHGHTAGVISVAFSPDGKLLASGGADTQIRLWDVAGRRELVVLEAHTGPVTVVRFSPDGKHFLSGGAEGALHLWDVAERAIERRFLTSPYVFRGEFLPDGKRFVTLTPSLLQVWAVDREEPLPPRMAGDFVHMAVSRAGEVAVCSKDGTVTLWDPSRNKVIDCRFGRLQTPDAGNGFTWDYHVTAVGFLKNSDVLIEDSIGTWRWDRKTGTVREFGSAADTNGFVTLADDKYLVRRMRSMSYSSLEDPERNYSLGRDLDARKGRPHDVAASPDGKWMATASGGGWESTGAWAPVEGPADIDLYDLRLVKDFEVLDAQIAAFERAKPKPTATQPIMPYRNVVWEVPANP